MNNPFDSSSPSANPSAPQQSPAGNDTFSTHTMKDDLEKLKNGEAFLKKEPLEIPPIKTPAVSPAPSPASAPKPTSMPTSFPSAAPAPIPKPALPESMPFLKQETRQPLAQQTISQAPLQKDVIEVPMPEKEESSLKLYLVAGLVVIAILGIGFGGYYFWATKTSVPNRDTSQKISTAPEDVPVVIVPPTEKYSQDKPNYLTLDIAKITTDDIKTSLIEIATELKNKAPLSPYEFIVVDINNNPVAFPIFATAAKLNLSPTLLENLGEDFSLFFYNDAGNIRLAVVARVTNKDVAFTQMINQEITFVSDASLLFLNSIPQIKSGKFGDNNYNGTAIRFLNLDPPRNTLSIDYSFTDSRLVIGTSKNTLRAVLDKLAGKTTVSTSSNQDFPKTLGFDKIPTTPPAAGKTVLDCDQQDAACLLGFTEKFEEDLAACNVTKGTANIGWEVLFGITRSYEITGLENDACVVNFSFLKTADVPESLLDSSMVCKYNNSERTIDKVADLTNCSGPLYDQAKAFMAQNKAK